MTRLEIAGRLSAAYEHKICGAVGWMSVAKEVEEMLRVHAAALEQQRDALADIVRAARKDAYYFAEHKLSVEHALSAAAPREPEEDDGRRAREACIGAHLPAGFIEKFGLREPEEERHD